MAPLLALFLLFSFAFALEVRIPEAEIVIGKRVPDISLTLDDGSKVKLSDIASGPLLVSFIYTRCTSACPMIVKGIKDSLNSLKDRSAVVLLIDFDLRDNPADLSAFRKRRSIPSSWFLALPGEAGLKKLAQALDFKFDYDPDTDMFAHPNVLAVLSKDLKVSGYMLGVRYDTGKLEGIIDLARRGEAQLNPVKSLLLRCFRYDPITGTYTVDWSFIAMITGGLIPILGFAYFLFLRDLLVNLRRLIGGSLR